MAEPSGEGWRRALRAAWLPYAAMAVVLAATVVAGAALVLPAAEARGVRVAALIACGAQLAAFGLLVYGRSRATLFLAGWVGGMLLRFGVLAAVAMRVTQDGGLPAAATLVSLAGLLFVLLLLEPVFLRRELSTR